MAHNDLSSCSSPNTPHPLSRGAEGLHPFGLLFPSHGEGLIVLGEELLKKWNEIHPTDPSIISALAQKCLELEWQAELENK